MNISTFNTLLENPTNQLIFLLLTLWSLVWKGIALWRSSKNNQKNWFIVMLITNTFGILEIIYMFYLSKPKDKETSENQI